MSKSETVPIPDDVKPAVIDELLENAKRLRQKAERLEKASDRLRAQAARDLADYLEGTAAEVRKDP